MYNDFFVIDVIEYDRRNQFILVHSATQWTRTQMHQFWAMEEKQYSLMERVALGIIH